MIRQTITGAPSLPVRDPELTIPEGGKDGQILVKTPRGLEWADQEKLLPEGGTAGQVLTKTASGYEWADLPAANLGAYGLVQMAQYSYDESEDTQTNFESLIDALKSAGIIGSIE